MEGGVIREMGVHKIICGKSEIELKQFDDDSFDSCVSDPPYGLEFMGRDWDKFQDVGHWDGNRGYEPHKDAYGRIQGKCPAKYKTSGNDLNFQQFTYEWATELYRVMKPGAHILVFGGTRTYHRMACGVEDAGFEVRDMVEWIYGSGFPKSLNISKQLDKMAGEEREVIGQNSHGVGSWMLPHKQKHRAEGGTGIGYADGSGKEFDITAPTTEEAIQYDGFGTSLKPSHEPILLARKPISERNIAANVLKWGVGGLNIDSCRIKKQDGDRIKYGVNGIERSKNNTVYGEQSGIIQFDGTQGRFPPNLILDEEAGRMLDEQSGQSKSVCIEGGANRRAYHEYEITNPSGWKEVNRQRKTEGFNDTGGCSRFYYQAKASQNERWFYCTICKHAYPMKERDKHIHNAPEETKYQFLEFHPTQKPEELICYLMRLITPPNGTTIDPFLGSGTAIIAAEREGFNCVGIDSKPEYCEMGYVRGKAELVQQKISGERSTIERIGF